MLMYALIYIKTDISEVFDGESALQLAAQVLDEFDDEEIGVGVLDAKLDKAVAKKLGNASRHTILLPVIVNSVEKTRQNCQTACVIFILGGGGNTEHLACPSRLG